MSTSHQVHGMSLELALPDWPVLTADEIRRVLQHFSAPVGSELIRWHSARPFSAAACVDTASGTLIVKRHHRSVRNVAALREEHVFMAHLRWAGAPVVEVLHDAAGRTALADAEWVYEVQRAGLGQDLYRDALSWTPFSSAPHAVAAGAALARLHLAAQGFDAPPRRSSVLVANLVLFAQADPLRAVEQALLSRPGLAADFQDRPWRRDLTDHLLPWHARAWSVLSAPGALPPLWTHGDWHASNLLWRTHDDGDVEVSAVFDFGLCDRSFAMFDLATAIERNLIPWLNLDAGQRAQPQLEQLDALLDGYARHCALGAAQLRQLAALLPIVHADFALSEIEYFAGITRSADNADIAYHRYLLGHADWFASADGQRLLDHLHARARRLP
ncbi:phosphotransferase [Xanthomonas arboricola]|uniref:phosphotransferase enzyme family protein n=1 Tax=Xanthomonas arboricola TaxID=56448 RepID=UPI0004D93244|nr:phosphotransferase [Xanthomonas arboricola]AKU50945.1 aminoglycoside phosphotransferase [Xanthomonas arboricola pv. juglandis]KER85340.1 aminoglycoside phosphotransferase [Xanthomonas arboricola pv. celebensis]KOB23963.1 aminoglycoside phosphotransferase [Xanthomonas arboricola]KOB50806.1 aminoglycoside phosphotransferase [Xanthomonas arboricola]MEA5147663.1 phosphotransferase [Xanthomonas arboricola]